MAVLCDKLMKAFEIDQVPIVNRSQKRASVAFLANATYTSDLKGDTP
jgi:hypothetical protein